MHHEAVLGYSLFFKRVYLYNERPDLSSTTIHADVCINY